MAKSKLEQRVEELEGELELLQHFVFKELLVMRAMVGRPLCEVCAAEWAGVLSIYDDFFEARRDLMVKVHVGDAGIGMVVN